MRFKLTLQALHKPALLPFNYQYPLSSAIYKIIQSADQQFASFLHNRGYGEGHKSFKLFTFSDIRTPFSKNGDRMVLQSDFAELIVCFYISQAAENFIKGLFINQQIQIADHTSKTTFQIIQVESQPSTHISGGVQILQPVSPLVVGRKNERGHYDYRSPQDEDFVECLVYNWLEKLAATHKPEEAALHDLRQNLVINVRLFSYPPQSRLITIKGGTDAETKIRGYTKFRLQVTAPDEMIELALGAGLGLYNAQGMGCVELMEVFSPKAGNNG
ncbi:MAG TPA: CRISPR-associated endoribonuclease Cas6 [Segetibacter sp.]